MDPRRFDTLARSLAGPKTRRGFLGGLAALAAGLAGSRGADARVAQAQCGNTSCRKNPGRCNPGCVCCDYGNGNSRCRPPGTCSPGAVACPPGQILGPSGVCSAPTTTTTTTTTPAPTTSTTTTQAPTECQVSVNCDPGSGACVAVNKDAGVACGTGPTCAGGSQKAQDTCDGSGTCVAGATTSCGAYLCNDAGAACRTTCASDGHCAGSAHCDGGTCQGDKANGEECDEDDDCQSGACNGTSGFCCSQACGAGVACTGPDFSCGPTTCGHRNEPCCEDGVFVFCLEGEGNCHVEGQVTTCRCGGAGQSCCAGNACDGGVSCSVSGRCEACGGADEDCCATPDGTATCNSGLFCTLPLICRGCAANGEPASIPCCSGTSAVVDVDGVSLEVCTPCGTLGEVCCLGACPDPGSSCNATTNTCVCGSSGQACCAGNVCGSGLECDAAAGSVCRQAGCGHRNEPCCEDGVFVFCLEGEGNCHVEGQVTICRCGGAGQSCCAGNACDGGVSCSVSGRCEACGGADEDCCATPGGTATCNSGLFCTFALICRA